MGQLKSLERGLQRVMCDENVIRKTLTLTSTLVMLEKLTMLNWRKPETSFNVCCPITLSSTRINPRTPEEDTTQQRGIKMTIFYLDQTCCRVWSESFFLPRTPNSAFSRHRGDFFSSRCPMWWKPMLRFSLARRYRAEDWSLRVYTIPFWGEELADFWKLRLASSGER